MHHVHNAPRGNWEGVYENIWLAPHSVGYLKDIYLQRHFDSSEKKRKIKSPAPRTRQAEPSDMYIPGEKSISSYLQYTVPYSRRVDSNWQPDATSYRTQVPAYLLPCCTLRGENKTKNRSVDFLSPRQKKCFHERTYEPFLYYWSRLI